MDGELFRNAQLGRACDIQVLPLRLVPLQNGLYDLIASGLQLFQILRVCEFPVPFVAVHPLALEGLRTLQEFLEPGNLIGLDHPAEIHGVEIQILLTLRDYVAGTAVFPGGMQLPACRLKQGACLIPEGVLDAFIRPTTVVPIGAADPKVHFSVFHHTTS